MGRKLLVRPLFSLSLRFFNSSSKHTNRTGGIVLETLTIDPSAQGLGIGSKMLDKGLEDAKNLGLTEAWLEASDAGYPLYKRYGWRDVEILTTDFAKYGAEGSTKVTIMKRDG